MSSTGGTGAVFFLGSRAHYQVLQQPETRSYDLENGNSTETIYQNPSVQAFEGQEANSNYITESNWECYENDANMTEDEKPDLNNGVLGNKRIRETTLQFCEGEGDMMPALLNHQAPTDDGSMPKSKKPRRLPFLSYLWSLAQRRRKFEAEQAHNLRHLQLATCTYRESCRCLDCQSRYFECDEGSDEDESSSVDSEYREYVPPLRISVQQYDEDEDDEVFVDNVVGDNASTDMLLETKEPPPVVVPAAAEEDVSSLDDDADMQLEVAAGTPVLLNYLLTHPITCAIQ